MGGNGLTWILVEKLGKKCSAECPYLQQCSQASPATASATCKIVKQA